MPKFAPNRFRDAAFQTEPPSPVVRRFHQLSFGYEPTPLHPLPGGLSVKDESRRYGLNAYKILGASWALQRTGVRSGTVATATDGNHGQAVACMARRRGLQAVVYLPSNAMPERLARIRSQGAQLVLIDEGYDEAVRRCAADCRRHGWHMIQDTGFEGYLDVPQWIVEGYSTLFVEAMEQMQTWPDLVVLHGGVGSFAAAGVSFFRQRGAPPLRIAVAQPEDADAFLESIQSPDGEPRPSRGAQATVMDSLRTGEASEAAWPILRAGVDYFLTITDHQAHKALAELQAHGIRSGPSGAAGLAGLRRLSSLGITSQHSFVVVTEGPLSD